MDEQKGKTTKEVLNIDYDERFDASDREHPGTNLKETPPLAHGKIQSYRVDLLQWARKTK